MRFLLLAGTILLSASHGAQARNDGRQAGHVQRDLRKTAADHVTMGWVLTYDNPDPERSWDRIPGTLVVARHGRVIRRWHVQTVRNWAFWAGGQQVAMELGGMHGPTGCELFSVRTGKQIDAYPGNCQDEKRVNAPGWVTVLEP